MQTANVVVALGGDKGTTVPKYGVTASEIAVLMAIHGNDAVFEIEPTAPVERSDREEIARLHEIYTNPSKPSPVDLLFPGRGAVAIHDLADLDLHEEFFKAKTRVKAPEPEKKSRDPLDHDGDGRKGGSKRKAAVKADEPEDDAVETTVFE